MESASTTASGETVWAGRAMPDDAEIWTGRVGSPQAAWEEAEAWFTREPGKVRRVGLTGRSPYAPNFTQGATFTPRFVFVVETREVGALGVPSGKIAVQSSRSVQEKAPWKDLPSVSGVIESAASLTLLRTITADGQSYVARQLTPMLRPQNRQTQA